VTRVGDTTAATTTSPTSTSTTTTIAATTTVPETTTTVVATEALIKQAVQDYIRAYFACGQTPTTCDPSTFTASQGPSRGKVGDLIKGMNKEGLYFSEDVRGSYLVAQSVSNTSEEEASAIYCAYDALTVFGPIGPDGLPTVVNDVISSSRYEYSVFRENGRWLVGQQKQIERLGEGDLCAAT
jgi:hypothetical protein